jgi:transcriptional regulatory protein RtcR
MPRWLRCGKLAGMAEHVGMSPRTFQRRFADSFGQTPAKFFDGIRLDTARHLLEARMSVANVALKAGYQSESAFRDDLYARLNLWTFILPGLADRREDIEPNLDYELDRYAEREGNRVAFNKEARDAYLKYAISPEAHWNGNFRDLASSITRMATLAPVGRIDIETANREIARLKQQWMVASPIDGAIATLLDPDQLSLIDPFDRVQLAEVIRVCRASRSLSDAGRTLFAASRARRSSSNDADRLRKYLSRFKLDWASVSEAG